MRIYSEKIARFCPDMKLSGSKRVAALKRGKALKRGEREDGDRMEKAVDRYEESNREKKSPGGTRMGQTGVVML